MRKLIPLLLLLLIAGAMVFVLFHNKAEVDRKANNAQAATVTPVSVMTARKQTVDSSYTRTSTIVADNEVSVVAQASGKVVAVYADVGSRLNAGAPLFKIDDAVLRSKLASARTAYDVARKEWERAVRLHQEQVISDSDLESCEETFQSSKANYNAAQQDYNDATITAPVRGVVTERAVALGATVSSGTVVATLIDDSAYKITVNVGEQEAFKLKTGDAVKIETDVYPGVALSGRIRSISGKSDAVHTFPVEVQIVNDKTHPLKSGIFGKVTFHLGTLRDALVIPREALVGSVKEPRIYVAEHGVAKLRDIVVGAEVDAKLVVTAGLSENEPVIVSGQENLRDNAAIKVIHMK
ncbi:RND family efflux transporter MFP subunit [Hydrogenispora ethanolica]|jgi:RND family efflux transporter MFP subunit|uniref:RND family efflux transporter MFP subunit n=1 Tax=Hydrogenispora ethanolica TaxID=1082276 RepID=A0A4R1S0L6_HYDET|nr:efflux RND transporter periplasmic adaptor subunit [Hydrogenispora ethanolica]TCL72394.1 RND family efflux transporter MFP subunit [Hydrogenispora ethanolica]